MVLEPRYSNYWLDLARKEAEAEEKNRKMTISNILAGLLRSKRKKP